ncbi:hypothetical protein D3C87_1894800 [compost metagenome]
MPGQHIGIEEVPAIARQYAGADACPCLDQALGRQRLQRLAQDRARHAEPVEQFGVGWQNGAFGIVAGDNGKAHVPEHVGMKIARQVAARQGGNEVA